MVTGRPYQRVGGSPEEASWEWMSNSHTPWAKNVGRRKRLKCYVQGSGRRKKKKGIDSGSGRRDYALFGASVFSSLNPGPGSFAHRRIWDPEIKSAFPDITLRARWFQRSRECYALRARTRYNGANLYLLLLYILKELAHAKATRSKASLTTTSTTHHVESYSGASHSRQIEEDKARQLAVMNLAIKYDNACGAKDDLRKTYEECNHIPQETRILIDTFLKEGYNKDYEMHNSLFGKAAKIEKQMNAKLLHQLHLDEEALREILEEKARDKQERDVKIRQKQADDEEFFLEFGMVKYDTEYESD
ncbi:hypothetical protein Tco_1201811 [Tanacetum coccineum]